MAYKVLITGSCGFIFSNFVIYALQNTKWDIVSIDKLTYAGSLLNVPQVKRHKLYIGDVCDYHFVKKIFDIEKPDVVIHGAAESMVDRSIENSQDFVTTNVIGTHSMLEAALNVHTPQKFINVSCYDTETKALTKDGLKDYTSIKAGDIVFTINPDTMRVEEQPIEKVIIQNYSGHMVKFKKSGVDNLITPNHRVYDQSMNITEAGDWVGANDVLYYPRPEGFEYFNSSPVFIGGEPVDLEDLFYLTGVFLGDGFVAYQEKEAECKTGLDRKEFLKNGRDPKTGRFMKIGKVGDKEKTICKGWRVFLDIPENDKARMRTENVLSNLNIKFSRQSNKSGEHLYFTSKNWVEFFNTLGSGAKNKHIPKWMLEYEPKLLKCLFDGLIDSDGCRAKNNLLSYTTISDRLRDDVCELAVKLGLFPNISCKHTKSFIEGREIEGKAWAISFSRGRNKRIKGDEVALRDYDGKVWCISVKNKNFLTERNGHFVFSGNTDEVYGSVEEGASLETDMLEPRSPYCVTPDTKVILDNGQEIDICNISTKDKITAIDIDNIGGECIKSSNLTNIFRKEYNGDILTIKTKHNLLNCTPEHKLFIKRPKRVGKNKLCYRQNFNNLPIMEIRAEELSVGDWVICPKKIDFDGKETFGSDFWRFAGYFVGDGSIHKNYGGRKSRHIRLADGDKELLGKYRDLIVKMTFDDKLFSRHTEAIKIDDNLVKDFCDQENLCVKNVKRWRNKIRKPLLGASPSFFKHSSKNCWYLKFGHKKTLMNIDKLGLGVKARFKTIPSKLFDSTNEEIAAFLAGLFDANGTVVNRTNGTSTISYSSSSKELMTGVRSLLRRFGIISTISLIKVEGHSWYKLSILDSISVCTFNEKIPIFKHKNQIKWSKSQNNMQEDNVYYSVVKSISKNSGVCSEVYDIENANEHNFIASGILVHNSSTKASADLLGQSYAITHDLPVVTTRCSNNFGPRQHMEKLIPKVVTNILTREKIPLYGDGKNMREWIYVKDNFSAIHTLVEKGKPGEIYNISSGFEKQNIEVLHTIFDIMGEGRDLLEYVTDRKGHDRRYSVNCDKLKALGWEPQYPFEEALAHTIGWYKANTWFWR